MEFLPREMTEKSAEAQTNAHIEGVIQIFDIGDEEFNVVFTSEFGTGKRTVDGRKEAERFIADILHRQLQPGDIDRLLCGEPGNIRTTITLQEYNDNF